MSFLTPRLFAIANMVNIGENIADIGTDHAYLPIFLAKDSKAIKIFASDIAEGPLNVAKHNIDSFGVKDKVELILSNGIEWTIDKKEHIDTCIIAGMGSSTILEILENDNHNIDCYILASNTNVESIRHWIKEKKYYIETEIIIEDNKILYEIIKVNKFAGFKIKNIKDVIFGPILRKTHNKIFLNKWLLEEEKLLNLLNQVPKTDQKYKNLIKKKNIINKYINKELKENEKNKH